MPRGEEWCQSCGHTPRVHVVGVGGCAARGCDCASYVRLERRGGPRQLENVELSPVGKLIRASTVILAKKETAYEDMPARSDKFDDICTCGHYWTQHLGGQPKSCVVVACQCVEYKFAMPGLRPVGWVDDLGRSACGCGHMSEQHVAGTGFCGECECPRFSLPELPDDTLCLCGHARKFHRQLRDVDTTCTIGRCPCERYIGTNNPLLEMTEIGGGLIEGTNIPYTIVKTNVRDSRGAISILRVREDVTLTPGQAKEIRDRWEARFGKIEGALVRPEQSGLFPDYKSSNRINEKAEEIRGILAETKAKLSVLDRRLGKEDEISLATGSAEMVDKAARALQEPVPVRIAKRMLEMLAAERFARVQAEADRQRWWQAALDAQAQGENYARRIIEATSLILKIQQGAKIRMQDVLDVLDGRKAVE